LIEEVLQEATTTVTTAVSQFDLKNEAAFWLGLAGTVLAAILAAIRIWEWWTTRLEVEFTVVTDATDKDKPVIGATLRVRNKGKKPTSIETVYFEWTGLTRYRSGIFRRRQPVVNREMLGLEEIETGYMPLMDLEGKKEQVSLPFRIQGGTRLFHTSFDPRLLRLRVFGDEVRPRGPRIVMETTRKKYVKKLDPSDFRMLDVGDWEKLACKPGYRP
jgi:hypothetical protein